MLLVTAVFGYGLLLIPTAVLSGAHVAAIGLSLSLVFGSLAAALLVAFAVINFASFEAVEAEGRFRAGDASGRRRSP